MLRFCFAQSRLFRGSRLAFSRYISLAWQEFDPPSPISPPPPPFVVSHGLLGSKRNWTSVARELAKKTNRKVYAVDLRNHGNSPHTDEMNFFVMADDVVEFCRHRDILSSIMMGHSMGGRVAMTVALRNPEIVDRLVIVDSPVGPISGIRWTDNVLSAMNELDLSAVRDRRDADEKLRAKIEKDSLRQFLLTNLRKTADGNFEWMANVPAISNTKAHWMTLPKFTTKFTKETLFIGALKPNITGPDMDYLTQLFPSAKVRYLDTGHFVHADDPDGFVELVDAFVNLK